MNKNWHSQCSNVDELSNKLVSNILETLDVHAPLKDITIPESWGNKKWWTQEIDEEIKERNRFYRKAIITNSEEDWRLFKQKRNKVVSKIKNQKIRYYIP